MNTRKVIVFSTLVAANIVIWYEVFGIAFLMVISLVITIFALFGKEKQ